MSSPSERYAAMQSERRHPISASFAAAQRFELDDFQRDGCYALEDGYSVLVAAPTGAGKTIVGEFAIHLAMQQVADRAFYTTPIKALSNQKFRELVQVYGADNVGLLTGDTSINSSARIVVMTTEVLRNMLYAVITSVDRLRYVIMDEVHYLGDRFRGAVWEEIIIHLPRSVAMVALSATVSNAEEFGDWIGTVRGNTRVIVSEVRPVPLEQHLLVGTELLPLFSDSNGSTQVNRELLRFRAASSPRGHTSGARNTSGYRGRSARNPRRGPRPVPRVERADRPHVVQILDRAGLLPAIFFIFSRAGCDSAVTAVRRSGLRITTAEQRAEIRAIVAERIRSVPEEDLAVLGFDTWRDGLERGVAAHHAGLLPVFKEIVEELFHKKLIKAVFATETLALGVNMPARTVVLEKLDKFNGEARVPITAGEYTQFTGRAGRRGIDVEGHAVVQWHGQLDPEQVASLASRRTYPLHSSFRPTYNMAVNLIGQVGRQQARVLLEASFAQFQADRSVVSLARKVRDAEESLAGYRDSMACDRGDFVEYASMRRELSDLEKAQSKSQHGSRAARESRLQQIQRLRKSIKSHPCVSCPDREQHARWAERYWRLRRDTDKLRSEIENRTGTVARVFDRVIEVLAAREYVTLAADGEATLTPAGSRMRRIYGERDLLVAESIRTGLWDELDPAALAAMACAMVYEPRRDEDFAQVELPRGPFRPALHHTQLLWAELDDLEHDHRLPGTIPIAAGLTSAMQQWASGAELDRVLITAELSAGDFIRWAKQTIDLLDQLTQVADPPLSQTARTALDSVRRGIVAYSAV